MLQSGKKVEIHLNLRDVEKNNLVNQALFIVSVFNNVNLKLQFVSFASLSPSLWKPGIAAACGIILLAWDVLRHGFSVD